MFWPSILSEVENPPRLTLKMAVSTVEGEMCVRLETILRIVRLTAERPS